MQRVNMENINMVPNRLYLTNFILARLALLTDHVRMENINIANRIFIEDYRNIQSNLSKYCELIFQILVFIVTC